MITEILLGKGNHAGMCIRYGNSQTYLYKLWNKALDGMKVAVNDGRKWNLSKGVAVGIGRGKRFIGNQALVIAVLK